MRWQCYGTTKCDKFVIFSSTSDLVRALRRSGGDLFIENAGTADGPSRVKILGVVSADCH